MSTAALRYRELIGSISPERLMELDLTLSVYADDFDGLISHRANNPGSPVRAPRFEGLVGLIGELRESVADHRALLSLRPSPIQRLFRMQSWKSARLSLSEEYSAESRKLYGQILEEHLYLEAALGLLELVSAEVAAVLGLNLSEEELEEDQRYEEEIQDQLAEIRSSLEHSMASADELYSMF